MTLFRRAFELKESLAGPPSRRAAYYTLVQASYACLAGSFEMPMAFRLAGRIDLVAFVYAFYYTTLFGGFALGMVLVREGGATRVYRASLSLWAALSLGAAILFPYMIGIPALICYFLVRGLAEGLYWSARHRAFLWSVKDARRDSFALRLQSIVVSLSVVLPLLGGAAITYLGPALGLESGPGRLPVGYVPVFILTGSVMLLALLGSPKLEIGRSPLSFRAVMGVFKLAPARSWCYYLALTGVAGTLLSTAGGIQTFGVLKTEFRIGALNAGIALLSSFSFLALGKYFAGRKGARLHGVLLGSLADFFSRAVYAILPTAGGLAAKSLLDALIVPLKSLLGENVQFALIERLCRKAEVSASELYLFREMLFWFARLVACLITGFAFVLVTALANQLGSPDAAPRLSARALIALSAPVAILEYFYVRSFAKDNAAFPSH
jgi:hypothetical protein